MRRPAPPLSKSREGKAYLTYLLLPVAVACGGGETSGSDDSTPNGGSSATGGTATTGGASTTTGGTTGNDDDPRGVPQDPPVVEGCAIFTSTSAWNRQVAALPTHTRSDAIIDAIGRNSRAHPDFGTEWDGAPIGIPFVVVDEPPRIAIDYVAYGDESDPGPFPIPLDTPVEGGPDSDGDRHVLALDKSTCRLYELYRAFPQADRWQADSGVEWDLTKDDQHPPGCTSADAAGLPVFPGLVRYDEVLAGEIRHAIRFTVTRSRRAYVAPATHYASNNDDPDLPAMGERLRMKSSYDCSTFSAASQVVCVALKKYGMILADNGSNFYLSGAPDPRWDDDALNDIKTLTGDAFEVVATGATVVTEAPSCVIPN